MKHELLQRMDDFPPALLPFYQDRMGQALAENGLPAQDWNMVYLLLAVRPEAGTAERLAPYLPYSSLAFIGASLARTAETDLVESDMEDGYRVNKAGEEAFYNAAAAAQIAIDEAALLEEERLQWMAERLEEIVAASLGAEEPASKRHLERSRLMKPEAGAGFPSRIDQAITDLLAFRDDAHQAAWESCPVGGHAWEVLTVVWREAPQTADQLLERLAPRSFETSETEAAIQSLLDLGWLEKDGQSLNLTEKGREIRLEAEGLTDRLFFEPWAALEMKEQERLLAELDQYIERLKESSNQNSDA
jgi:hypothetical protein